MRLPYPQLLHRLAVHRQVPNGGWARLADQMLVDLLPSPLQQQRALLLLPLRLDRQEAHPPLGSTCSISCSWASSSPGTRAAAAAAASCCAASRGANWLRQRPRAWARQVPVRPRPARLAQGAPARVGGAPLLKGMEALHARAAAVTSSEQAGRARDGAGGGAGPQGSGLLTVKEAAPALRQLAPFFTEVAKSHDPFEESYKLALDAILRLAQRLHLTQPTAAGAVASASALGGASLVPTTTPQQPGGAEDQHGLLSRWLSLLCHIIHSSSTTCAQAGEEAPAPALRYKGRYLEVRDRGLANSEMRRIRKSFPPRAPRPAAAQRHRHHPQSQASRCTSPTTSRSSYATRCSACTRWRPRSRATGSGTASPRAAARTAPSACCCAPCSTCRARRSLALCVSSLWALMGGRRHRRRASTRLLPPRVPRRRRLSLL